MKKSLKAAADAQKQATVAFAGDETNHAGTQQAHVIVQASIPISEEEKRFIQLLHQDLEKINAKFMEREEDAVIKLQHLVDKKSSINSNKEAESLRAAFVDFHGEMVLLLHWSLINYAGVIKILKKHDKLLGKHAQRAGLNNILRQPFTSTESISRLVREAEANVQSLTEDRVINFDEASELIQEERGNDESTLAK